MRVLVVDDNRDAAQTLARLLKISGHQTQIAFQGDEALEAAATMQPQVALLDIGLPGMDGYELARRLKQAHPGIYLAAISGYGQAADRQRAKEAGFDEHFVKPVKLESLLQLFDQRQGSEGLMHRRNAPSAPKHFWSTTARLTRAITATTTLGYCFDPSRT